MATQGSREESRLHPRAGAKAGGEMPGLTVSKLSKELTSLHFYTSLHLSFLTRKVAVKMFALHTSRLYQDQMSNDTHRHFLKAQIALQIQVFIVILIKCVMP